MKKLESDSTERELEHMVAQSNLKIKNILSMIEKHTAQFNAALPEFLVVGEMLKSALRRCLSKAKSDRKKPESLEVDLKPQPDTTLASTTKSKLIDTASVLKSAQARIDALKNNQYHQSSNSVTNTIKTEHLADEEMVCDSDSKPSEVITTLNDVIEMSSNQSLEMALNRRLNEVAPGKIISLLAESILKYEFENRDTVILSQTKKLAVSKHKRCVINILLDYFCHFDPQIVSSDFDIEFKLLFELKAASDMKLKLNSITHSFLLSLFIHQASWSRLYTCVQHSLATNHTLFATHPNLYTLNPTIVLDFLASLIHIPELWKGTESKLLQKYNEENVLDLAEGQICCLVDFITEEMFLLHDARRDANVTNNNADNDTQILVDLHINLSRRVQLLKHFFNNTKINKDALFKRIISHLHTQQRKNLFAILNTATANSTNLIIKKLLLRNSKSYIENLLQQIQSIFLYSVYLEENSIIYHVPNASRTFSAFYSQIDVPTELDRRAHNLLNCFGEIEVNFSNNLTSSGIIGVASGGLKKQEKQELIVYAKKQETFMMDANIVCVKMASSHVFLFLRQLPMMEGLLQGRVAYTFDEFKRRKFDKLFHYVIDLLNVLIPFVFHPKYVDNVELIISHYFDVFMVSFI
jgi:hypothetical protein